MNVRNKKKKEVNGQREKIKIGLNYDNKLQKRL